jgi:hypothetical protein
MALATGGQQDDLDNTLLPRRGEAGPGKRGVSFAGGARFAFGQSTDCRRVR